MSRKTKVGHFVRDKADKKKGTPGYRAYSVDMPAVDAFAKFKATPLTLREACYGEGVRSEKDYLAKIGHTSQTAPEGWFNAPGFWERVEKYEKSFRVENILLAKNTLQRRMMGMKTTRTRIKKDALGNVVERETTEDMIPPDVTAAAHMLKACGSLQDEVKILGLPDFVLKASEAAEKDKP